MILKALIPFLGSHACHALLNKRKLAALCLTLVGPSLSAQTLQWDANGSDAGVADGGGTWTTANANWWNGTTNVSWNNLANNIAVFGNGGVVGTSAAAATVTVSGTVNAGGLRFDPIDLSEAVNRAYILSGGTIALTNGASIVVNNGTSNTGNGRITINSAISGQDIILQKDGGGNGLIHFGGANTWTGTLTLLNTSSGGFFANITNLAAISSLAVIDVQTTHSIIINYSQTTGNDVAFQLAGNGSSSRGAIRFDQSRTLSGPITLTANAGVSANTVGTIVGTIAGNIGESGGSRTLTLNTNGSASTVVLSGNNSFTGGLVLTSGVLQVGSTGALNASSPNLLTFAGNTNAKTVNLSGFSVSTAGLSSLGTEDVITVQNASATAATLTLVNTSNQTFRGILADGTGGGALTLVKSGAGTQALTGIASSYSGGTVLNGGILSISGPGSLGATPSSLEPANIRFNGGTLQFNYAGSEATPSLSGNRGITLDANGGTLHTPTHATYYAGPISGDGSLTKTGAERLILAGPSTYTGPTLVTQGILEIRHGQALGSTAGGTQLSTTTRLDMSGGITVTGEALMTPYLSSIAGNNTWAGTVQAIVGATLTLEAATGSQLNVTGNINATDAAGGPHSFNLVGAGVGVVSGEISNALLITKSGAGSWTLSGDNTFTNGVSITQGQLILASAGAVNSAAPNVITFANNANSKTLSIQGISTTVGGLASVGSTGAVTENGSATDATLTLHATVSRTYLGTLTDGIGGGKLAITKTGTGTQVLGNSNTYTGDTTVTEGTLQLNFNAVGAPANQILSSSTALVMNGGTLVLTGSATTANSQTVNGLTVAPGHSTLTLTPHPTTPQDLVLNLGAITHQTGGTINFVLPSGTQTATNGFLTSNSNDASGILGPWALVNGSDWATVSGGNIVPYTAYIEVTNFSSGPGALGPIPDNPNANVKIIDGGTSGNIALANGSGTTDINTLIQSATGVAVIGSGSGQTLRLGTHGAVVVAQGAGNLTIGSVANNGSVLTAGGSTSGTAGNLIFTDQTSDQTTTVNSNINDNGVGGTVSLIKNGPGTLILSGTGSNYTGGSAFNGGIVRIAADGSLGSSPGSAQPTHLTFNGGTLQWNAAFSVNANRGMTLLENGGTLDTQGFAVTHAGIITGSGNLTKLGAGTLTLSGANTHAGETFVNAGTLIVNHANALGTTAGGTTVAPSAVLRLNQSVSGETLTITGVGNNQGNLQVAGIAATWGGDIIIGGASARIGTNGAGSVLTVSGVIRDGTHGKLGISALGGTVILTNQNSYTGVTEMVRGTLRLGIDNALPVTTQLEMLTNTIVTETIALDLYGYNQTIAGLRHIVVSNVDSIDVTNSQGGDVATLTIHQNNNTAYNGRISGNLALVKDGTGTLTLTNTYNLSAPVSTLSTFSGKTTIQGGTLALSGTGNLSGTPWIQVDEGATFSLTGRTGGSYEISQTVLSGTGNVTGELIVSGNSFISPGDSIGNLLANAGNGTGELTFDDLTLTGGSPTLRALFQLGGTPSNLNDPLSGGDPIYFSNASSGGLYDSIQVDGTLGLNAGSTLRVELLTGYSPQLGDVFNLLDWALSLNLNASGGGNFTLSDLDLASANAEIAANGWYFETDQFINHGLIYVVVPEPSRTLLLLGGLIALVLRRRRTTF